MNTITGPNPNEDFEELEKKRIQSCIERGEKFVPEGTGDKRYIVVCKDEEDWKSIDTHLVAHSTTLDPNIPFEHCPCTNEWKGCPMGSYVLNDLQVNQLKQHPKVSNVYLDPSYYTGTFQGAYDYLKSDQVQVNRYSSDVLIARNFIDEFVYGYDFFQDPPGSNLLSRTGASVYRHQQKINPWNGISDTTNLNNIPKSYATGKDVDIIVCDTSAWYGHIEFIKTGVGEPTNFIGENVLKSGFAPSATTGVCCVLDSVLDAPYYIDPDFFEADSSNRLMTRWDGTTVPVESWARNWWNNESTTYRSAKYVSTDQGGTAVVGSQEDFGEISISGSYTRAGSNGSNTQGNTGSSLFGGVGTHGTPCMAQAYGKTQGWAYNANKWHVSIFWDTGSLNEVTMWLVMKVFHQNKPNRSIDNTKNPTITSHSWGTGNSLARQYYYWRTAGDGTGAVAYDYQGRPGWLRWFYAGNRFDCQKAPDHPRRVACKSMMDAGVLMVCASGNNNQQMVKGDHPNYNNYDAYSNNYTLEQAADSGDNWGRTRVINRPGTPGDVTYTLADGSIVHPAILVGALDEDSANPFGTAERKVEYSNMGNAIDCYAIGDGSLAGKTASGPSNQMRSRYDSTYVINGVTSVESQDGVFNGTSSACPVTCGLIATKLEYNRDWTWVDIKSWLNTEVEDQTSEAFPTEVEAETADDPIWADSYWKYHNLQGGFRKILWDAPVSSGPAPPPPPPGEPSTGESLLSIIPGAGLEITGRLTITELNN